MAREAQLVFQHDSIHVTGRLVPGKRGPVVQAEITEEPWNAIPPENRPTPQSL